MESLFVPLAFVAFPLAVAVVGATIAWRAPAGTRRRRTLLGFAVALIAIPVVFFVLMLTGETIDDLGVGPGLAMLGPWLLAAIALLTLAVARPDLTLRVLAILAIVPIGFGIWSAVDPSGFGAWLDGAGPLNLVASYLLITTATVVALRRPRSAGLWILVIAGVPAVLPLLVMGGAESREGIIAALNVPALVAAVLMVLAGTPGFVDPAEHGGPARPDRPPSESDRDRGRLSHAG